MKLALTLLLASLVQAQVVAPLQIVVNWPPHQLVVEKYGPLPNWAIFGEVVGCNKGNTNITFGEGDVIATLRTIGGLQAFSRQDAFSLVSNSQSASKKNIVLGWLNTAADSVVDAKAAGLIGGGNGTGVGIVVGAAFVKLALPSVNGVLSLRQVIQYNTDGIQTMMQIPAGRCTTPLSVLFAVPNTPPIQAQVCPPTAPVCVKQPYVYDVDVPQDK